MIRNSIGRGVDGPRAAFIEIRGRRATSHSAAVTDKLLVGQRWLSACHAVSAVPSATAEPAGKPRCADPDLVDGGGRGGGGGGGEWWGGNKRGAERG